MSAVFARLLGEVTIRTGQAVWITSPADCETHFPELHKVRESLGYQACAALPVMSDQRALGCLLLGGRQSANFTDANRDFLRAIAHHFGLALDRARLYEEERRSRAEALAQIEVEQMIVGVVSHDLKNPVNAIQMAALLLARRDGLDERQVRTVARITSSATKLQRMIEDLLDFTQARLGGGIPIKRRQADLAQVAREVVDEARGAHPDRTCSSSGRATASGPGTPTA